MLQQSKNYFFSAFFLGLGQCYVFWESGFSEGTPPCSVPIFRVLSKLWGDSLKPMDGH